MAWEGGISIRWIERRTGKDPLNDETVALEGARIERGTLRIPALLKLEPEFKACLFGRGKGGERSIRGDLFTFQSIHLGML